MAHPSGIFPVELGNMLVGTSATRTLTFTNRGSEATTVGAVSVTSGGGVALSNNTCTGQVLAQNASCTVDATVTVAAAGPYASSVSIAHSTNPTPDVYNFTATGVARDESLTADPDTIAFGFVGVNTASAPQTVTVTNNGNVDATIANVFVQGNASMYTLDAQACVTTLAPGASCTLTVTFTPTATGSLPSQLRAQRGSTSVVLATLSGTGGQGVPQFSQSLMQFTGAVPGTDAPTRPVTLRNVGNARLDFAGLGIEGDQSFRVASTTCTTSLAVNETCTAEVTVRPPDGQSRSATLLALAPTGVRQVSTVELTVQPAQVQPTLEVLPKSTNSDQLTEWMKEHVYDYTPTNCTKRAYDVNTGQQTGATSCWSFKGTNIGVPAPATSLLWMTGAKPSASGTDLAMNIAGYGNCDARAVGQNCGFMTWGYGLKYNNTTYSNFWSAQNYVGTGWSMRSTKPANQTNNDFSCDTGTGPCNKEVFVMWRQVSPSPSCLVPGSVAAARAKL